jgi:hypothetical protein
MAQRPDRTPAPIRNAGPQDLSERWSVQRKHEVVLLLLLGESLDKVSRETQVPAHALETWPRRLLDGGQRGLRAKADPEERELALAKAKLGEVMMPLELAQVLLEKRGLLDKWKSSRR